MSILIGEVKAWTQKYERLRELLTVELGLADINDIRAAEARGYQRAVDLVARALDVAKAEPRRPPTDRAGRICALGQILADLLEATPTTERP